MKLYISAFVLFILSISTSCNIEKRIEKRQETFDKIGRKWLDLHPCANDSTFIYIPGKKDSIPVVIPVVIKDSIQIQSIIDSLNNYFTETYASQKKDCRLEISKAYNAGYDKATQIWKEKVSKIKVAAPIIDTVKITLKDKQAISLLQSDLDKANQQLNDLKVKYEQKSGSSTSWLLMFIIACGVVLVSIYFNLKK